MDEAFIVRHQGTLISIAPRFAINAFAFSYPFTVIISLI